MYWSYRGHSTAYKHSQKLEWVTIWFSSNCVLTWNKPENLKLVKKPKSWPKNTEDALLEDFSGASSSEPNSSLIIFALYVPTPLSPTSNSILAFLVDWQLMSYHSVSGFVLTVSRHLIPFISALSQWLDQLNWLVLTDPQGDKTDFFTYVILMINLIKAIESNDWSLEICAL